MVNARLVDWTEAYESQSIFLWLILSLDEIYTDSSTLLRLGLLS
jgi:hypothetical protein